MTEKWYYGLEGHKLAKPLRDEVFVDEQGFPAHLEDDEHEGTAWHYIVEEQEKNYDIRKKAGRTGSKAD